MGEFGREPMGKEPSAKDNYPVPVIIETSGGRFRHMLTKEQLDRIKSIAEEMGVAEMNRLCLIHPQDWIDVVQMSLHHVPHDQLGLSAESKQFLGESNLFAF